jgi:hypothetical protein
MSFLAEAAYEEGMYENFLCTTGYRDKRWVSIYPRCKTFAPRAILKSKNSNTLNLPLTVSSDAELNIFLTFWCVTVVCYLRCSWAKITCLCSWPSWRDSIVCTLESHFDCKSTYLVIILFPEDTRYYLNTAISVAECSSCDFLIEGTLLFSDNTIFWNNTVTWSRSAILYGFLLHQLPELASLIAMVRPYTLNSLKLRPDYKLVKAGMYMRIV